jgi:hypothetical protein
MSISIYENINGIIGELEDLVKNPDLFIDKQFESFSDKLRNLILRTYILSNFNEDKGFFFKQKIQDKVMELFNLIADYDPKKDYQDGELLIQKYNLSPQIESISKTL